MGNGKPKVCFAASSGGHLEELLTLRPLMDRYDSFLVTEKTAYRAVPEGMRKASGAAICCKSTAGSGPVFPGW